MSSYGHLQVSQTVSIMPAAVVLHNAATGTGAGTSLPVTGYVTALLQVTGTFVGTIVFEGSVDDTNWGSLLATQLGTTTTATSTTTTGTWSVNVAGLKSLRARISAFTSGAITVDGYVSVLAGVTGAGGVTQAGTWAVQMLDAGGSNKASISAGGAVKVDGSSATQPVSGTFWQATQPAVIYLWPISVLAFVEQRHLLASNTTGQRYVLASNSASEWHLLAGDPARFSCCTSPTIRGGAGLHTHGR